VCLRLCWLRLRLCGWRTVTGVKHLLMFDFQNLEILESGFTGVECLPTFEASMDNTYKRAPHNPPHWFQANAIYMLTASIYQGEHLMVSPERKAAWRDSFIEAAKLYDWHIIAWVVLDNHYHAMVESLEKPLSLSKFIGSYHKFTARLWNDEENISGRKVWWNYWDTCIRSEKDFNNRLRYIFWNPVKHGLTENAEDYPFSSYKDYLEQQESFDFTGLEEVNDVPEF
jgi:putative transposase